jgi:hypothetical protein
MSASQPTFHCRQRLHAFARMAVSTFKYQDVETKLTHSDSGAQKPA